MGYPIWWGTTFAYDGQGRCASGKVRLNAGKHCRSRCEDIQLQIAVFENWADRGILVTGGFGEHGIESTDALERAEEMGRNF